MIHLGATVNPFPAGEFVLLVLVLPKNGLKGSSSKPETLRHLLHVGMHNRLELKQDDIIQVHWECSVSDVMQRPQGREGGLLYGIRAPEA